jgi:hypothetical protein
MELVLHWVGVMHDATIDAPSGHLEEICEFEFLAHNQILKPAESPRT